MKKLIGIFFLATILTKPAWSQTDCTRAKNLLADFLKLDAQVGRLSSEDYQSTFSRFLPDDFDEPGWDTSTIIQSYHTTFCKKTPRGLVVGVTYQTLGELSLSARNGECPLFEAKPRSENTEAHLTLKRGQLKIVETPGNPHIGMERALQWIRGFEKNCKTESATAIRSLKNRP